MSRVPGTVRRERLIPVPSLAGSEAPTPAAIRQLGLKFQASEEVLLREHPEWIAAIDQLRAAEAALTPAMRTMAGRSSGRLTYEEIRDRARGMLVSAVAQVAMLRAVEARCQHVDWPPTLSSPRTVVSVTARAAICGRPKCAAALQSRWHDDGLCELCERPTDTFVPFMTVVGPCFVTLELCDECAPLMGART